VNAVHQPSSQRAADRVRGQTLFPFGVDEFFLTNVLRTYAVTSVEMSKWLFFVLPTLDSEVKKALGLLKDSSLVQGGGGPPQTKALVGPLISQVVTALSIAAGKEADYIPRGAASDAEGSHYLGVDAGLLEAAKDSWPSAAAARLGLWNRHAGTPYFPVLGEEAASIAGALKSAFSGMLELMSACTVEHTVEDLQQCLQNLAFLSSSHPPALATTQAFTLGGGGISRCGGGSVGGGAGDWNGSSIERELLEFLRNPPQDITQTLPKVTARSGAAAQGDQVGGRFGFPTDIEISRAVLVGLGVGVTSLDSGPHKRDSSSSYSSSKRPREEGPTVESEKTTWRSPPQAFPNWEPTLSRSSGLYYFFNTATKQSVWHDPSLPFPWAWEKGGPSAPKVFVNLITGAHTTTPL